MAQRFKIGDLVRYGDGPTALMRITSYHPGGYHGRAFHSSGTCIYAPDFNCREPYPDDVEAWKKCHDSNDQWIRGAYRGD